MLKAERGNKTHKKRMVGWMASSIKCSHVMAQSCKLDITMKKSRFLSSKSDLKGDASSSNKPKNLKKKNYNYRTT